MHIDNMSGTNNSNGDSREKSSNNRPQAMEASPPIPIISNISRSISSSDREDRFNDGNGRGERQSSDLTKALGELHVGSLPIHMTSPVKNRLMNSQRSIMNNNNRNNNTNINYYHSSNQQFIGSASLPAPNAPFLSSREGPKDKLRSMPEVILPESTLSNVNSIQYGSLRESSSSLQYGSLRDRGGIGNYFNANNKEGEVLLSSSSKNSQTNSNSDAADERRRKQGSSDNNSNKTTSLSSSLTALSILTRIKEPPDESGSMQQQKNNNNDNGVVIDDRPMNDDEPMEKEEEDGGGEDANPDTFEAFDFEI